MIRNLEREIGKVKSTMVVGGKPLQIIIRQILDRPIMLSQLIRYVNIFIWTVSPPSLPQS